MRKLVTIQKIEDVQPIEGADAIEKIKVLGWWVVAQKSIGYKVGDLVVYHEIDSFLPEGIPAYQFLVDKSSRLYNQRKGHVVRSIKLRGQISQGFCVPLEELFKVTHLTGTNFVAATPKNNLEAVVDWVEDLVGLEVTELLGVEKYEPPIPASLAGLIKGNFPSSWKKTDQERVQNLESEVLEAYDSDMKFEVTIKLDGSSMSFGMSEGDIHVCSRNLSLKLEQEGNTYVDTFKSLNMEDKLDFMYCNESHFVFQGELMGEGIQKNQEKLKGHHFFLYDVYDIQAGNYVSSSLRRRIAETYGLKHVPVLHESTTLRDLGFKRETLIDDILKFAEGDSLTKGIKREGVVFKSVDGSFSFKAISNAWLLKNQD